MAKGAAIPLSPTSPAGFPASGTALLRAAIWLMWGAALGEIALSFHWHGPMSPGLLAITSWGVVRHLLEPSTWTRTRPWARIGLVAIALAFILGCLLAFLSLGDEIAAAAQDSFHGVRLQVFLCLPVGLAGLILTFIASLGSKNWGRRDTDTALAGIWTLLPYLFPVGLALLTWFVVKRERFFPTLRTTR